MPTWPSSLLLPMFKACFKLFVPEMTNTFQQALSTIESPPSPYGLFLLPIPSLKSSDPCPRLVLKVGPLSCARFPEREISYKRARRPSQPAGRQGLLDFPSLCLSLNSVDHGQRHLNTNLECSLLLQGATPPAKPRLAWQPLRRWLSPQAGEGHSREAQRLFQGRQRSFRLRGLRAFLQTP